MAVFLFLDLVQRLTNLAIIENGETTVKKRDPCGQYIECTMWCVGSFKHFMSTNMSGRFQLTRFLSLYKVVMKISSGTHNTFIFRDFRS